MTVSAMPGVFGWALQSAKGSFIAGDSSNWYRHYVTQTDLGAQQVIQQFPAEVGGGFHPTGAFKSMAFGGGSAQMHPRLEDVFGWLMYGAVGQHVVNSTTVEAGVYRHLFYPPDDFCDMKWMQFRKYAPGECDANHENLGEIVRDARILGLQLTLAPSAILQSQLSVVGREPKFWVGTESNNDAGDWASDAAWINTFESFESVPLAHQGAVTLGGVRHFDSNALATTVGGDSQKATAMQIALINQYTRPQEEMIIGSPYPDDFVLQRQIATVTWTYKWQNNDLYLELQANETGTTHDGNIDWSPVVHQESIDVYIESPADITGRANPYRLRFFAPSCTWQAQGPPTLIGGGWLALQFQGVAQYEAHVDNASTGTDTFWFELENEVSDYSWTS